ncbi:hypothetical protein ACO1O0_000135 [Amphichorda felina]
MQAIEELRAMGVRAHHRARGIHALIAEFLRNVRQAGAFAVAAEQAQESTDTHHDDCPLNVDNLQHFPPLLNDHAQENEPAGPVDAAPAPPASGHENEIPYEAGLYPPVPVPGNELVRPDGTGSVAPDPAPNGPIHAPGLPPDGPVPAPGNIPAPRPPHPANLPAGHFPAGYLYDSRMFAPSPDPPQQVPVAPWFIPGNEHYPHRHGGRNYGVHVEGPLIPILVQDVMFYVPAFGLSSIRADPHIFGVLLEIVISHNGLTGTEAGINMVNITGAMAMALSFCMQAEFAKLTITFKRYIIQRVMYRNPHQPDMENILDHQYFVYRSEEIYRTWNMVNAHEALARILSPAELGAMYWIVIPYEIWPALTANFDDRFNNLIDIIALQGNNAENHFAEVYRDAWDEAGYALPDWMNGQPPAYAPRPEGEAPPPPHPPAAAAAAAAAPVPAPVRRLRASSAPGVIPTPPLSEGNTLLNEE